MKPALEASSVSAGYRGLPVIHGVSLSIAPGEIVGIIGPNGAGKTTLLRSLSGMIPLRQGAVLIDGIPLQSLPPRERARRIAWVQQKETVSFAFTVREWVEMGRYCHAGPLRRLSTADRAAVDRAIDSCCLHDLLEQPLVAISGGEAQRAHIARSLAQEASLLFLDEPLTHLDLKYQAEVFQLLLIQAHREKRAVICVIHDLSFAASFCDRICALRDGRQFLPSTRPDAVLEASRLSDLFGISLRESSARFQPEFAVQAWKDTQ